MNQFLIKGWCLKVTGSSEMRNHKCRGSVDYPNPLSIHKFKIENEISVLIVIMVDTYVVGITARQC